MCAKSIQSCLTLCDPMNLPGSCVHRILQERILEWVAISFSRESSLETSAILLGLYNWNYYSGLLRHFTSLYKETLRGALMGESLPCHTSSVMNSINLWNSLPHLLESSASSMAGDRKLNIPRFSPFANSSVKSGRDILRWKTLFLRGTGQVIICNCLRNSSCS